MIVYYIASYHADLSPLSVGWQVKPTFNLHQIGSCLQEYLGRHLLKKILYGIICERIEPSSLHPHPQNSSVDYQWTIFILLCYNYISCYA